MVFKQQNKTKQNKTIIQTKSEKKDENRKDKKTFI